MRSEVLSGFTMAARSLLAAEMGAPIEMGRPVLRGGCYQQSDVTAIIRLQGDLDGAVLFSIDKTPALRYASQVMGEDVCVLDSLVQSGVAELCNMIAGRAGLLLEANGCHVHIAPPKVLLGRSDHAPPSDVQRLVVPITTPLGAVQLQVVLKSARHQPASSFAPHLQG